MLGTLRLILALAVAASHAGFYPWSLNPGVAAVIGFYLISGYVMAGLQQRHYPGPRHARGFYIDRCIRIMPQYLLYAGLTLAWQVTTKSETLFLRAAPSISDLLNNLLIVPLNYYMWNGSDHYTLIPPAWSLGAEIQFYLIAPLILLWPRRIMIIGALSLGVFGLAMVSILNNDWFGYRLLPGVLSFFLLGALLQHLHRAGRQRTATLTVITAACSALATGYALRRYGLLFQPYNQETLIGLCFVFPLLHLLAQRKRHAWDDLLGDISYGVFLNHFLIIWVFYPQGVSNSALPVLLATSIVLSLLSQRFVERPLLHWRQNYRKRPDVAQHKETVT